MQVKQELTNNVTYQIHAGNSSIWSAPWCPLWNSIHDHLLHPITTNPLPSSVSDLWIPNTHLWNVNLLNNTFDQQAVQQITNVPTVPQQWLDILRWTPAKTGQCTTKNVYRYLATQNQIQLPTIGSRSILP
jgi:hypothetical protein